MPRSDTSGSSRLSALGGWRRNAAFAVAIFVVLLATAYATRCTLLLNIARIVLSRDTGLLAQERKDGVTITFADAPMSWVKPMKNLMNPIWLPIQSEGVNYFTFGAPRNWLQSFSERSNPRSPYYQAWVGGYVTKRKDGTLPADLPMWASQVTALDQRSWLSAMGDPMPIADFASAAPVGNIEVDGHELQLWHGTMRSHSDLSEHPRGPLAMLLGMPPKSTWPNGIEAFHDVALDGYFVCWSDPKRNISVVIYAVAAAFGMQPRVIVDNRRILKDELLTMMKSAKIEPLN